MVLFEGWLAPSPSYPASISHLQDKKSWCHCPGGGYIVVPGAADGGDQSCSQFSRRTEIN